MLAVPCFLTPLVPIWRHSLKICQLYHVPQHAAVTAVCPRSLTTSSSVWAVCSTLISRWWFIDSSLWTRCSASVPCAQKKNNSLPAVHLSPIIYMIDQVKVYRLTRHKKVILEMFFFSTITWLSTEETKCDIISTVCSASQDSSVCAFVWLMTTRTPEPLTRCSIALNYGAVNKWVIDCVKIYVGRKDSWLSQRRGRPSRQLLSSCRLTARPSFQDEQRSGQHVIGLVQCFQISSALW